MVSEIKEGFGSMAIPIRSVFSPEYPACFSSRGL